MSCVDRYERYGVSWREGEPETAIKWRWWLGQAFAEVRFFRIDPRKLRRINSTWWWYPSVDGDDAVDVARYCEERLKARALVDDGGKGAG